MVCSKAIDHEYGIAALIIYVVSSEELCAAIRPWAAYQPVKKTFFKNWQRRRNLKCLKRTGSKKG